MPHERRPDRNLSGKAIFDRPEDDAPRAVYADWLRERGEPLGRFISAQLREDAAAALALLSTVGPTLQRGTIKDIPLDLRGH